MSLDTYKDLVSIAVEKTLMDIGLSVAENVQDRLKQDYNSDFGDCLENPEYLHRILKDHYGHAFKSIIISIEQYLNEFRAIQPVEKFLVVLNK